MTADRFRELQAAYRSARYVVDAEPPFALRVDRRSPELLELFRERAVDCACYLTAWNPMGRECGEAENRRRQHDWLDALSTRGVRFLTGRGEDPLGVWTPEESLLLLDWDEQQGRQAAKALEQLAYLSIGPQGIPRLLMCR